MNSSIVVKIVFALIIIFFIGLGGFFIFYPDVPKTAQEQASVLVEAENSFNNNDLDGSIRDAERILKADIENIDALIALASSWVQKGSIEFKEEEYGNKAIEIAQQVLAIDPNNSEAYRIIGYAYEIQDKFDKALVAYDTSLEFNPDNPQVFNHIGHTYDLMGNITKAKQWYLKSIALDPSFGQAQLNLARVSVREGNNQKAIAELERVLSLTDNVQLQAETYYTLGNLKVLEDRIADAKADMQKAVELSQDYPLAWVGLGKVKFLEISAIDNPEEGSQNIADAFDHMEKAYTLNPEQTLAYLWEGRIWALIGETSNARGSFEHALSIVDEDITLVGDEKTSTREAIEFELEQLGDDPLSVGTGASASREQVSNVFGANIVYAAHDSVKKYDPKKAAHYTSYSEWRSVVDDLLRGSTKTHIALVLCFLTQQVIIIMFTNHGTGDL